jgi:uncharacterized UPF0160 family protein
LLSYVKDKDTEYISFPTDNWQKIMTLRTNWFESKKDLPAEWGNKDISGKYTTEGLIFIHQSLFIWEFDSLENLNKALKNN